MAYNVNNEPLYRSAMVTRLWGARIGLDGDNMLVGPPALKAEVQAITTSNPSSAIAAHGISYISGLGSSQGPIQVQLDAPMVGVRKHIILGCTSTGSIQFGTTANGAKVMTSSAGSSAGVINMVGPGGSITLVGLTTAIWGVVGEGQYGSTALAKNVTFTTST